MPIPFDVPIPLNIYTPPYQPVVNYLLKTYLIILVIVSLVSLEYTTSLAVTGTSVIMLSIPLLARFLIDVSLFTVHA